MSSGFVRDSRRGTILATFTGFEADLLRMLASQMVELLRNERAVLADADPLEAMLDFSGPTTAPEDPVLARLFPNAYPDDEEAAGEFRRFTEGGLRDGKAANAVAVIDTLEDAGLPGDLHDAEELTIDVELEADAVQAWLRAFADIRLALATRLGIETEEDGEELARLPEGDPRLGVHDIYEWVGYLTETLVQSLT